MDSSAITRPSAVSINEARTRIAEHRRRGGSLDQATDWLVWFTTTRAGSTLFQADRWDREGSARFGEDLMERHRFHGEEFCTRADAEAFAFAAGLLELAPSNQLVDA